MRQEKVNLSIIHIRLKQLYRAISGLGLFRSLFVTFLIVFLLLALYIYVSSPEWGKWISAAYVFALLVIHIKRPDKLFLNINFINYRLVFFFEYVLLAFPLLVCLLYLQFFVLAFVTLLGLGAIPFLEFAFQKKGLNNRLIKAIPDEAFEWKSGVRKYFLFIVTAWLTGISTSYYAGSVPAVIFILGLVIVNFYETGEPLSILMSSEADPGHFLFRKLVIAQLILSTVLIPLVFAFTLFHPEWWYIPVIEFVLISFILWYAIFLKYAFYQPNKQLSAGQLFMAIGALSLFLPFLIPLLWILSVRFYSKSIANLKPYLDDFN